ncbi:MAG: DUF3164 family protein [Caulobacteraceae bacterium]|nr:DUF3164 family protein [Caulobacteraceae bacterium]
MTKPAEAAEEQLPPGVVLMNGKRYRIDPKGSYVPDEVIRPHHKLEDQVVRRLFEKAEQLSAAMAEFKEAAFADIDSFVDLLSEKYGQKAGGEKGNLTMATFDGLMQLKVQVSDRIDFGPELQVARDIVQSLIEEWSEDTRPELRAILSRAFQKDKDGKLNRGAVLALLRYDIDDERWRSAMEAIRDSIKVVGSSRYIRFYRRRNSVDGYDPLSLDMATV